MQRRTPSGTIKSSSAHGATDGVLAICTPSRNLSKGCSSVGNSACCRSGLGEGSAIGFASLRPAGIGNENPAFSPLCVEIAEQ